MRAFIFQALCIVAGNLVSVGVIWLLLEGAEWLSVWLATRHLAARNALKRYAESDE